jgi:hypothetical protein
MRKRSALGGELTIVLRHTNGPSHLFKAKSAAASIGKMPDCFQGCLDNSCSSHLMRGTTLATWGYYSSLYYMSERPNTGTAICKSLLVVFFFSFFFLFFFKLAPRGGIAAPKILPRDFLYCTWRIFFFFLYYLGIEILVLFKAVEIKK